MKHSRLLKGLGGFGIMAIVTVSFLAMGCDSTGAGGNGDNPSPSPYTVSGTVTEDGSGDGIAGVEISFSGGFSSVTTNSTGEWTNSDLTGAVTVTPGLDGWTFVPPSCVVEGPSDSVDFTGTEAAISFAGGNGTEVDPYQVTTAAQLNEIRNHLSDHFVQTADIDLSGYVTGEGWEPIGPVLWGSFKGAGRTISGLFIDRTGDKNGLFAQSGGDIQDVNLVGVEITADGNWVGALVGTNSGTIENCTADGTVTQTGGATVGGLVGSNSGTITGSESNAAVSGAFTVGGLSGINYGTIENSFATGPVAGPQTGGLGNRVGGLVGLNENGLISESYATGLVTIDAGGYGVGGLVGSSDGTARIERSYATGNVVATGEMWYIGGLVGENLSEIEDSYATGDVAGCHSVGGFVGLNESDGTISRCYSYGTVEASGSDLGGFAGQSSGTIEASYWDTEASGILVSARGEGRTTAQMQAGTPAAYINPDGSEDTDEGEENLMYEGWDPGVWDFGTASDYPVLLWQ